MCRRQCPLQLIRISAGTLSVDHQAKNRFNKSVTNLSDWRKAPCAMSGAQKGMGGISNEVQDPTGCLRRRLDRGRDPGAGADRDPVVARHGRRQLGERVNKIADDFNATQSGLLGGARVQGQLHRDHDRRGSGVPCQASIPIIVQVFEVGTATMMAAEGAIYPVDELMEDSRRAVRSEVDLSVRRDRLLHRPVDGDMLSMPFNSSTPGLVLQQGGVRRRPGSMPRSRRRPGRRSPRREEVAQAAGYPCGFTTGWQSWVQMENYSAPGTTCRSAPRPTASPALDTELTFNSRGHVAHIAAMASDWQKDEDLRLRRPPRRQPAPKFTSGECAMYMNSSAAYAGIKGPMPSSTSASACCPTGRRSPASRRTHHRRRDPVGPGGP